MRPERSSAWWNPACLLVLGVLAGLVLLRSYGTSDMDNWLLWQKRTLHDGLVRGYASQASDYPPLAFALLWLAGKVDRLVNIDHLLGIKASLFVFYLGAIATLLAWRRDLWLAVASIWLLLPNGIGLAYTDVHFAPILLGALWAFSLGSNGIGLFLYTTACLIKWQPLIVAPFVLIYLFAKRPRLSDRRAWARLLLPTLALLTFVGVVFGMESVRAFARAFGAVSHHPNLSGNALNLHWVITWLVATVHPQTFGGLHDGMVWRIRSGADAAQWWLRVPFAVCYLATLLAFARRRLSFADFLRLSFVGYVVYFMLNTGVHENHLYVPALLALTLTGIDRRFLPVFLLWTTYGNLNQFFFYGCDGREPSWSRVVGLDLSVAIACVGLVMFAALLLDEVWHQPKRVSLPASAE